MLGLFLILWRPCSLRQSSAHWVQACAHSQDLAKCIRLNLDCADVRGTTVRVISGQTEYDANVTRPMLEACIAACRSCGDECAQHGEHGMEHCAVCGEHCRRYEDACRSLLESITTG